MKNITKITCAVAMSLVLINSSKAAIRPYAGLDVSTTKVESESSMKVTSGLTGGIKINLSEKIFIAPEIYYNFANKYYDYSETDTDYSYAEKLNNLYGARVHFGYNFNEKFSTSVFGGVGFFNGEAKEHDKGDVDNSKTTDNQGLLAGFSFGYNITENLEAKLNYEYQKIDHADWDERNHQFKFGINYNF